MDGRYLYAILAAPREGDLAANGLFGGRVYTQSHGQIAAVVSEVENGKIRPERRNLAAHQEVLKNLTAQGDLLPMSFGIVAESPEAVSGILSKNHEAFLDQLQRVAGRQEMGLRVVWDVPNIFELMVKLHPEMQQLRDRIFASGQDPSHDDKMAMGRMFERALNEDRETHTDTVEAVLDDVCVEIKRNKCRGEKDVMNLSCLIERNRESDFERAVFQAAALFDDNYAFDYNGPWAPHNFVDITLEM